MHKHISILLVLLCLWIQSWAQQPIKDANFLAFLKSNYPQVVDNQNNLITSQAELVSGVFNCSSQNISSLDEIQYFINITELYADTNLLTSLPDISSLAKLTVLDLSHNQLTKLPDLSSLSELTTLNVSKNLLTALDDLSSLSKLQQLIAFDNNITKFPSLSSLIKLEQIDFSNNAIVQVPSLKQLSLLKKLELSYNNIVSIPNLSENTLIKDLYLNNNQLDTFNVSWLPQNARNIRIEKNYLTWDDIIPLTSLNNYSSRVKVSPQYALAIKDSIYSKRAKTINISTQLDRSIAQITYTWFKNNTTYTTDSSINISRVQFSDAGSYTVQLSHPSFPALTINGGTYQLVVKECIDTNSIRYTTNPINCAQNGSITFETNPNDKLSYFLYSPLTSDTLVSTTGIFQSVKYPLYSLLVKDENNCSVEIASKINVITEPCEEIILTPNNDGDKDEVYLNLNGSLKIYNNHGLLIDTIQCPTNWKPEVKNHLLPIGYYLAYLNDGQTKLGITIVY